ncbi:MAG: beta-galactosidase [Phycisphaeraceae bacterium]|nr:beta-galactosidase [Phycisphaeraceae bacterium]
MFITARLDNPGAADWANSSKSQAYILPGESGTLTVAYPRSWDKDDSPDAFEPASAKPNGWRSHWKSFDPSNVRSCRLVIQSTDPGIKLQSITAHLAWPYGKEANQSLLDLPHIDRFGQSIPFTWPSKVATEDGLKQQVKAEADILRAGPTIDDRNQFGGYLNGPQLEATGYFRTEKHKDKWWLVDPSGRLFWSNGVCTVGNRAIAPLSPDRHALFVELPEAGTPEHDAAIVPYKPYGEWGRAVDFLRLNTMRKYGKDWEATSRDITHRRLKAWGFNTLGAWSDAELLDDQRTPHTEILHIWPGQHALEHTPDPYEAGFKERLNDAVASLSKQRANDPWMIGVFIDNEIVWHNNYPERVILKGPQQPAYGAFVRHLQQSYPSIESLNKAWGTDVKSWDALDPGKGNKWKADRLELFGLVADRYYRLCKQALAKHLPDHLYLGSRVHTCPAVVAEKIAKHVDVFSINHYAPLAGTAQLPKDADLPVMITEFHFGTLDRGVVGMSLSPVHGQAQRSRCFGAYVTAGLLHPNIVGTHWFAYSDQSTVGRPNENYQIGLIDITDQPYPEMTAMSQVIARQMYEMRLSDDTDTLQAIHRVLAEAQKQ